MDEDYSNGNSFLDYLNWGGKTATGVLGALNQQKAAAKPTTPTTNWALIAGIGAAVLVVLVLVVSLGGRGR
jgi:hypothetical protein